MHRRTTIQLAILAIICLAGDLCGQSKSPNIVLIISDDQKWTDYGFMGHPKIQTPNLDRLANQSVLFRSGYVPQALCRSSLMTLVTGLYPHQHQVVGNDPFVAGGKRANPEEYKRLNSRLIENVERFNPIAKALGELGYRSHQSGKWWEGHYSRGGFDAGMTLGMGNHPNGRHGDNGLKIGREGMQPVFDFVDQATKDEVPFFLWYAPFLPHTPHNPPQRLLEKYDDGSVHKKIAKYYAMCEWFDETCGDLINHLDEKGIRENTIIVYVCDNGWITTVQGETAPTGWSNPYAPRSKRSPNEAGVRTPIMFNFPGKWKNQDRKERISSIDIYPTILSMAGGTVPDDLPGLNLSSHLREQTPIARKTIFGESFSHDVQDVENPDSSLQHRWCIHENWKLILSYDTPIQGGNPKYRQAHTEPPQLYNLSSDPEETTNLAGDNPNTVAKMSKLIQQWRSVENSIVK